jgi:hypothetical protein
MRICTLLLLCVLAGCSRKQEEGSRKKKDAGTPAKKDAGTPAKKDAGQSGKKDEPGESRRGVTASVLLAAYEENGAAAALRYERKSIEVWGVVLQIEPEIIVLADPEAPGQRLVCDFGGRYIELLATIQKGQIVTVRGTISERSSTKIGLFACEPIDPPEKPPSKEDIARAKADKLEKAISAYFKDNEKWPDFKIPGALLTKKGERGGPYIDRDGLLDPWGKPFRVDVTGRKYNNGAKPDVFTTTPEGKVVGNFKPR